MAQDIPNITPQPVPPIALNITPTGMTITIVIAPGVVLMQTIPEDMMNEVAKKWIETRREVKRQMELVQNVMNTRPDDVKRQLERAQGILRKID